LMYWSVIVPFSGYKRKLCVDAVPIVAVATTITTSTVVLKRSMVRFISLPMLLHHLLQRPQPAQIDNILMQPFWRLLAFARTRFHASTSIHSMPRLLQLSCCLVDHSCWTRLSRLQRFKQPLTSQQKTSSPNVVAIFLGEDTSTSKGVGESRGVPFCQKGKFRFKPPNAPVGARLCRVAILIQWKITKFWSHVWIIDLGAGGSFWRSFSCLCRSLGNNLLLAIACRSRTRKTLVSNIGFLPWGLFGRSRVKGRQQINRWGFIRATIPSFFFFTLAILLVVARIRIFGSAWFWLHYQKHLLPPLPLQTLE